MAVGPAAQRRQDLRDRIKFSIDEEARSGIEKLLFPWEIKGRAIRVGISINKEWQKSLPCSYAGCSKNSVIGSHTIPKGMLSLIAKNGKVLTTDFSPKKKTIEFKETGISSASTFPGYCCDHEQFFGSFERRKSIENPEELILQIHRTTSLELKRLTQDIPIFNKEIRDFNSLVISRLLANAKERWKKEILEFPSVMSDFTLRRDYPLLSDKLKVATLAQAAIKEFLSKDIDPKLKIHQLKMPEIEKTIYVKEINVRFLPLALSGVAQINDVYWDITKIHPKTERFWLYFLTVLPSSSGTHIIIHAPKRFGPLVDEEIARFGNFANEESVVRFIEHFMITKTSNWFLCPDYSNESKKDAFLKACANDHDTMQTYDTPGFLSF